jgi:hypothetical protein
MKRERHNPAEKYFNSSQFSLYKEGDQSFPNGHKGLQTS